MHQVQIELSKNPTKEIHERLEKFLNSEFEFFFAEENGKPDLDFPGLDFADLVLILVALNRIAVIFATGSRQFCLVNTDTMDLFDSDSED